MSHNPIPKGIPILFKRLPWGLASDQQRGGLGRPGHRKGDESKEQVDLAGRDEPCVLEVEAAGLGIAKETFDGPAFAVGGKCGTGGCVGSDDEEFAALETSCGEVQPELAGRIAAAQGGADRADPAAFAQQRAQGEAAAVLGGQDDLLLHADGEGDVVFVQETHPFEPDKLAIRQQKPDAGAAEDRQIAPHQRNALGGVAGSAVVVEHAPHQRHARAPRDHGQHQDVDVAFPELPLGAVERQTPRPGKPQEPDHQRRRPVAPETDVLEEPLQPAVGRGDQRRGRTLAGQVAEVHRPGADHADDDETERLQPALAQPDMRLQYLLEGGEDAVRHWAILWSESS